VHVVGTWTAAQDIVRAIAPEMIAFRAAEDGVLGAVANQFVGPMTSLYDVSPLRPLDHVVPRTPRDPIPAGVAYRPFVGFAVTGRVAVETNAHTARPQADEVGTPQPLDDVVACQAHDHVRTIRS
jgi:hypothetical protein